MVAGNCVSFVTERTLDCGFIVDFHDEEPLPPHIQRELQLTLSGARLARMVRTAISRASERADLTQLVSEAYTQGKTGAAYTPAESPHVALVSAAYDHGRAIVERCPEKPYSHADAFFQQQLRKS